MKLTQMIATATTAAVLGTAGVSIAGAATSGADRSPAVAAEGAAPAPAPADGKAAHPRLRVRRLARKGLALAAKTIGITRADLVKELRAGKTIADVATAHSVAPQAVIDAIVNAATAKIDAAEKAGRITEKRAARLKQRLPAAAERFVQEWHPKQAAA